MSDVTKLPSPAQMIAIARESLNAKDKATQIHTPIKERKKSFYEVGNGNPKALALLESLLKIHGNNEIRADDTAAHCQQALDVYREHTKDKGHVGNLADMAEAGAATDADGEEGDGAEAGEPDLNATPTAEGGVPLGDAAAMFAGTKAIAETRRAARAKLDLPADGSAGAKPKRSGKKAPVTPEAKIADKYVAAQEQRLGKIEAAPPPPPAAEDEGEADLRPAFLRLKDEERNAPVH